MCGIYGWSTTLQTKLQNLDHRKVVGLLQHRGPDDSGYSNYAEISLGMVRLSINDLSLNGHQPMTKDGVTVVLNGEIYNFRDLRKKLETKGKIFKSNTDTEVVLELYLQIGEKFVSQLRGMFAIAIFDSRLNKTILARDIFGEKPLLLYRNKNDFFFSSELGPLVHYLKGYLTENESYLEEFLVFGYSISGLTPFNQIEQVKPGHLYIIENSNWQQISFDLENKNPCNESYEDSLQKLDDLLTESVRMQIESSDIPVGALVSSGIDSTLIAKIGLKINPELKLFTLGFEDQRFDESTIAKSRFSNNDNHIIHYLRYSNSLVTQAISKLDIPIADTSVIPMYELTKFVSNQTKVALTGDGGDELFLGYSTYTASLFSWKLNNIPGAQSLFKTMAAILPTSDNNVGIQFKLNAFAENMGTESKFLRHLLWRQYFSTREANKLLGRDTQLNLRFLRDTEENINLLKLQELDIETWLPNEILIKTDRTSMSNSLELRSPFLDSKLRNLAFNLPENFKFSKMTGKRIVKDLYKNKYDDGNTRFAKKGFGAPFASWLRQDHDFYYDRIKQGNRFDDKIVLELFKDHLSRKSDNSYKIFALLVYSEWSSKWLSKV